MINLSLRCETIHPLCIIGKCLVGVIVSIIIVSFNIISYMVLSNIAPSALCIIMGIIIVFEVLYISYHIGNCVFRDYMLCTRYRD